MKTLLKHLDRFARFFVFRMIAFCVIVLTRIAESFLLLAKSFNFLTEITYKPAKNLLSLLIKPDPKPTGFACTAKDCGCKVVKLFQEKPAS